MKHKNIIATLSSILIAVVAAFCATPGYAIIAYEPFSYTSIANGTATTAGGTASLTTAGGFTGSWTCGQNPAIVTGLTYTGLPTTGSAISSTGGRQYESFATPLSTNNGTVWISFLFQSSAGNSGGNINGVYFPNGGTGLFFGFGLAPNSNSQGELAVGSTTTTGTSALSASTLGGGYFLGSYGTEYLISIEIQYGAGTGGHDLITVYINPTAGQATPGVSSSYSVGSFTVGTITGVGLNVQGAGSIAVDEIRVGNSYADSVGFLSTPAAPAGVTATAGTSQVVLNWPAVSGATTYNVLQGTSSGGETSLATGVTGTSYTDTTAANGNQYFYVIQASNTAGTSGNSAEVNATPMAAPTGLAATPGNNFVALTWSGSTGASGYNVKRSGTSGGPYTIISTPGSVTSTAYTDNTAVAGTTYYYVVSATNTVGESLNSLQVSSLPVSQPPTAPTGLTTVATNSQVTLNWTAGTGDVSYNVKRSTTSGSGYATISATGAVNGTSYTDSTAVNGNIYYYVVSGTNSSGESANSSQSTASMPPATPTGLGATPGANQVVLSWVASSGASGANSYNVKRSTNSGSSYVTISTSGAVTGTTYTDSTALSGTTYYYVVSGVNGTGEGRNSSQATTTPTGAPQAPTGVTVITNYTTLTLSWSAALGAPTGYVVKRSTTTGTETTLTNVSGTTFTDTSVNVGTEYFYTVSATNSYGTSASSPEVTGTAPGQPFAYESFNYGSIAAGTPTTAAGFTGDWTVNGSPQIVGGLTYPNLTTANGALESSAAGDNFYENLSTPLLSGTVWVSFLFYQNGDNGGNRSGLELLNSSGNGVMFCYHQYQTAVGTPCIDSVNNYSTVGTDLRTSATTQTYAQNNLYVLKLTYTAGVLTSIAVYTNPTAGQNTAPAADFTVTSGLSGVGAITTIGVLNPSGISMTVDEWNVGTSFGAVVPGSNITTPLPPTGLTATPGNNSVSLSWNYSSGATTYNVLQGTSSGTETTIATGVTSLTFTDTSAANGTKYFYEVQAVNTAGTSANSAEVNAVPAPPPAPPAPTGLVATPGNNSVSLSWNTTAGATSYNVLQGTSSGGESVIATGVTQTNYVDNSAVNGTEYFYEVQAVNSGGTSTNSAEVNATPVSPTPLPPTGLAATPGNNFVTLSWNASAGATSYNVLQGTSSGGESTLASGVTGTSFTDNTANNGTEYFYEVQAVNGFGPSANSAEVNVTPGSAPAPIILPVYRDSTGTNLVVTVATQTGFNYYLLTTTNLTPPVVWSTNTVTAGTGGTITNTIPITPAQPNVFIGYFVQ